MALHLNLYHEVQKQKALRRRDPLKLGGYGLGAIALCLAGFYFLQLGRQSALTSENKRVQTEHDQLAPKALEAQKRADEISAMLESSKKLVSRIEERLLWAPILEILTQAVPAEIQLVRLAGDVSGESARRCTITVDGIAAGEEARQVAEDFRRVLGERFGEKFKGATSTFKTLEDSPDTVKLGGKTVPTASFSINLQVQGGLDGKSAALQAAQPAAQKTEA